MPPTSRRAPTCPSAPSSASLTPNSPRPTPVVPLAALRIDVYRLTSDSAGAATLSPVSASGHCCNLTTPLGSTTALDFCLFFTPTHNALGHMPPFAWSATNFVVVQDAAPGVVLADAGFVAEWVVPCAVVVPHLAVVMHYFVTNTGDSSTNGPVRLPADEVASYEGVYRSFGTGARIAHPCFTPVEDGVPYVSKYVARTFTGPAPPFSWTCTSSSRLCPPPPATSE